MKDRLLRAWLLLLALSAASTALSVAVGQGTLSGGTITAAGTAILVLAWAKARIIVAQYLGLAAVPALRRGFDLVLALLGALLLALTLAA